MQASSLSRRAGEGLCATWRRRLVTRNRRVFAHLPLVGEVGVRSILAPPHPHPKPSPAQAGEGVIQFTPVQVPG